MAYVQYHDGKPVLADDGGDVIDDIRENLEATRDALVLGSMPGWALSVTTPAIQPTVMVWAKGVYRIRATITYGTSGVTQYMPTQVVYEWNGNSGIGAWDQIGTHILNYDVSGYLSGSSWS